MQATCWPSHNLAVLHWVVNKGWQHLRVMTCLINLIKEGVKDKSVIEERKIRLFTLNMINFGQNVEYVLYKNICVNLYASPVCGCWCVFGPDHSVPGRYSFPAQSGRQLLSLHWSCVARTPWLISLVHCDWLAFPLRGGKTGRRGVGLSRAGISRSFHTASHWMHIHNVFDLNVKAQAWSSGRKERKCCSHLPSTHLCHKCNWLLKTFTRLSQIVETGDIPSNPVLFFIHLRDAFRPPAPPSLCRWRCHMWRLWSKQGVELPACWYSALFVSYGRTLMRRGSSCSTQTPKIIFYFHCRNGLHAQAMQRWFRTMDSAPVQRERGGNKQRRVKLNSRNDGKDNAHSVKVGEWWRIFPCL